MLSQEFPQYFHSLNDIIMYNRAGNLVLYRNITSIESTVNIQMLASDSQVILSYLTHNVNKNTHLMQVAVNIKEVIHLS